MITEKRKSPRFKCSNPQEYPIDFKDQGKAGCLFDFSRDGLSFQSSHRLEDSEIHKFEIWVSALEKPVSCEIRIMWVHSQPGTGKYTCGARILRMDPSSKIDLLDILYQDWKKKALNAS